MENFKYLSESNLKMLDIKLLLVHCLNTNISLIYVVGANLRSFHYITQLINRLPLISLLYSYGLLLVVQISQTRRINNINMLKSLANLG
jgi:hypothetical protein